MALPANELLDFTTALGTDLKIRPRALPQAGLGMLKLKDSALQDEFYLGEFPLASAWLEVSTKHGQRAEGAAQVMDDRVELAEALALCDAILSAQLPGWQQVAMLVDKGLAQQQHIQQQRKRILAHTQVNFSLLDDVGDDDAEA